MADRGELWAAWVRGLPATAQTVLEEWRLTPDGSPMSGYCSLVLPVHTDAGVPAVLKLGFPDDESEHEHLGLRAWNGAGAVLLLRADPHRRALLLERVHGTDLHATGVDDACEIVGGLYSRLHVAAPASLRPLAAYVTRWGAGLARLPRSAPVPRRLVEQAVSTGAQLVAESDAGEGRLLHADLHYGNVLAGGREPWLVIDPKPVSGDPHYEPAPMLWNRWDEVLASTSVRHAVRRRFHTLVDAAGLDEDRARDWVVFRSMHNALWTLEDAASRGLLPPDRDHLTCMIAVAKAVQD